MGVKSRKMLNYKKVETTETMATLSDLIQVIWPEIFYTGAWRNTS